MAMTIPFLDLVKRTKEKFESRRRPTGPAPLPSVQDKPESDKLAKRVMPYAVRTMTPESTAPALAAASVIAPRRNSLTRQPIGAPGDFGPRADVSVEPRGERTLSLALSDVIAKMPDGYLKPQESFDTTRRLTLRAAEVEESAKLGTTVAPFTTPELPTPMEPLAGAPATAQSAPASPPVQPPPLPRPPVVPATSRTIPPPRIGTVPTQDGSMSRITFVTPSEPAENKPEKPLPIGTGGSAFPRVPASSGPPVPPAAPPTAGPARIPFQAPPQ